MKFRGFCRVSLVLILASTLAQPPHAQVSVPGGSLPSLGDSSDLAAATERRIGDRIAVSIYRDPDYVDDPLLVDYVQGIWLPLMAAARSRGELQAELDEKFAWQVFLIRDKSINAFALPGGYFGVHLGLIAAVTSPDEMAAVLAHEISHVTQRHISRLMTQQTKQAPWMFAAMILGALAAGKNSDVGSAAILGGQAVAAQNQLNFSRDMEREADRVGFGVMTEAGFESRGVASMFEKLQQASRLSDNGSFPYLRSHPLSTERIAEARARLQLAETEPRPPKGSETETGNTLVLHAMMAARARILAAPGVDILRSVIAEAQRRPATLEPQKMPASAENVRDAGALYAASFASAQLRDFTQSRSFLARLKTFTAANAVAAHAAELLGTEIDLLAGAVPASASSLDLAKATSRPDVLMQSRALLAAQRARDVSERLQTWVAVHPKDATAWQILAVAYGNQGQSVRAIRADAEGRAAQLDYSAALDRFRAAQTMIRNDPGSADHMEASIIDTRARQMESLVKEQALQDKIDR